MEQKYFISYVAYQKDIDKKDFFNDIIYIDEDITINLIEKIQDSLLKKINDKTESKPFFATQIISMNILHKI
jgi:hypothetical protein